MFCVMGPMHWAFGGLAAGKDYLSYLSFGNVQQYEEGKQCVGCWLYWIHAFIVWGVVIAVTAQVNGAQKRFLAYRFAWLRGMPELRANTILVEGIPEEYRNETKLNEFFGGILPGVEVVSTYLVKDTLALNSDVEQQKKNKALLDGAEAQQKKDGTRPMVSTSMLGTKVDAIEYYTQEIKNLEPKIKQEQDRINKQSSEVGGVNLSRGFVTF